MEDEEYRQIQAMEADIVSLYNCDPTRSRGDDYDSKPIRVPALGKTGNPAILPRYKAMHLLKHAGTSEKGVRGWLTLDKAVFDAKLKEWQNHQNVTNPQDANVIATSQKQIVVVSDPKLLAEYQQSRQREALGLGPKPAMTEERGAIEDAEDDQPLDDDYVVTPHPGKRGRPPKPAMSEA